MGGGKLSLVFEEFSPWDIGGLYVERVYCGGSVKAKVENLSSNAGFNVSDMSEIGISGGRDEKDVEVLWEIEEVGEELGWVSRYWIGSGVEGGIWNESWRKAESSEIVSKKSKVERWKGSDSKFWRCSNPVSRYEAEFGDINFCILFMYHSVFCLLFKWGQSCRISSNRVGGCREMKKWRKKGRDLRRKKLCFEKEGWSINNCSK